MSSAPERDDAFEPSPGITRGLLAVRVLAVSIVVLGVPHWPDASAHRFVAIAHTPGVPWRDSEVEYAFGDWLVIRAVGWGSEAVARALLGLVAFGADLVAWRAVLFGWGRAAATRYLWLGTPLLVFIYRRSDLVPVALAALALGWAHEINAAPAWRLPPPFSRRSGRSSSRRRLRSSAAGTL